MRRREFLSASALALSAGAAHAFGIGRLGSGAGALGLLGGAGIQKPNLVTNGNFALNPVSASQNTVQNGWQWKNNAGTGTVTWDGVSIVSATGDGTNVTVFGTAALQTTPGQSYTLMGDFGGATTGISVGTAFSSGNILATSTSAGIGKTFSFTATTTTTFVSFTRQLAGTITVTNISVR